MDYKINFLGWNTDGTSDKIWGYMTVGEEIYNFWGARTKSIAFKHFPKQWDNIPKLTKLAKTKKDRGYAEIDATVLEAFEAGWVESFEKQFVIAKLFDKFHMKTDA